MRLSVVIPVYNERSTIESVLDRVLAVPIEKEVIVVDDGSTDGTREVLAALHKDGVRVFFQDKNRGKGAAVRRGFEEARAPVLIVQDADLEYFPEDYPALVGPIEEGRADVVYGSRFLGGRNPFPHKANLVANKVLTFLSNLATGMKLTDMETCYKAMRRDVAQALLPALREDRFGFEPEVTARIAARGYRVAEVPVRYQGRTKREGKKIGVKDGFRALWCIVRYGVAERRAGRAAPTPPAGAPATEAPSEGAVKQRRAAGDGR